MSTGNLRLAQWLPRDLPLTGDTVAVTQADPLETQFTTADFPEAPLDGKQYGRQNEGWTPVPPLPFASDAPSDGNRYGRRNAAWSVIPNPEPDAPADGKDYARRNNAWQNLDAYATDAEVAAYVTANAIPDAPNDGKQYARQSKAWALAPTVFEAPVNGKQYARKDAAWVETSASSVWIGDVPPTDATRYPLWWDSTNLRLFIWFNDGNSSQWVDTNADPDELRATFVPEAPNDGKSYVRKSLGWADAGLNYVLKAGDTMTGALNIQYADAVIRLRDTKADGITQIQGIRSSGSAAWHMHLGSGAAKDFRLYRETAAGAVAEVFSVLNATGETALGTAGTNTNLRGNVTGVSKAMVGLGSVEDARQVRAFQSGLIYIGWEGTLNLQVDATYFANTWPINISGNSVYAPSAGNAATVSGQDRCGNWGYAGGNFSLPYMRMDTGASIRYLLWQTNNDSTVYAFRTTTGNSVLEITGSGGAFGCSIAPCDERLKANIKPATVDATAAVQAMELVEFDFSGVSEDAHVPLGFSAQNLQGIDPSLVFGIEQPEESPMHALGTVLNPHQTNLLAYLTKALQEALARIAVLEGAAT